MFVHKIVFEYAVGVDQMIGEKKRLLLDFPAITDYVYPSRSVNAREWIIQSDNPLTSEEVKSLILQETVMDGCFNIPNVGWKFVHLTEGNLTSEHGSTTWDVGKSLDLQTPYIETCYSGYHSSPTPRQAISYVNGDVLLQVKFAGYLDIDGDKIAASRMEVLHAYSANAEHVQRAWCLLTHAHPELLRDINSKFIPTNFSSLLDFINKCYSKNNGGEEYQQEAEQLQVEFCGYLPEMIYAPNDNPIDRSKVRQLLNNAQEHVDEMGATIESFNISLRSIKSRIASLELLIQFPGYQHSSKGNVITLKDENEGEDEDDDDNEYEDDNDMEDDDND